MSELNEFIKLNKETYEFKDIFEDNLGRYSQVNEYGNIDIKFCPLEDIQKNEILIIAIEVFNYEDNPENYICTLVNIDIQ